ncbi:MAG: hypothetical protein GY790_19140 [Bacteroidetes bacterium]|nr:hypothetical protein [Bacteroidota bacterium]
MNNSKIKISVFFIFLAFLFVQFSVYQHDVPSLLNKEAEDQYFYIAEQIESRAEWYNRIEDQAFNRQALILPSDRDPLDVLLRRSGALLEDLGRSADLSVLEEELNSLKKAADQIPVEDTEVRQQYFNTLFGLRRKISFSNPLLDFTGILFTASLSSAGDFHMCDQYYGVFARPGGSILKLNNAFSNNPTVTDLIADKTVASGRLKGRDLSGGMFLFPELSYDGQKILFAYSECARDLESPTPFLMDTDKWSKESSFHIFSMDIDGADLSQITDGAWNDFNPCWLPNGNIAFISERRGGFLRCSGSRPCPNYTLHSMEPDGSDIVRISHHETNEWHPSVNNQGMLLYTRWDYVDRGDDQAHHPWKTSPDGRDPRAIQGNYKYRHHDGPDMEVYVRPIPNSNKYVSLAAPHHGGSYGTLIIIDPSAEDDDGMSNIKRLTPEDGFPESRITYPEDYKKHAEDRTKQLRFEGENEPSKNMYSAAWALSENYYLTTRNKKLYLIDAFGNAELLYEIPGMYCLGPVPFKKREKPLIIPSLSKPVTLVSNPSYEKVGDPHRANELEEGYNENATVMLLDVYNSLFPFPANQKVEELRIVQILQKTTPVHQKPAIGYGAETSARRVLGTVPVEEDGSASFYMPPGKSVYFQAVDENGEAIQSMRSATYVQGGEKISCIGCHEKKSQSPNALRNNGLAFKRAPSVIKPEVKGSNPFSYPLLVQPVLDKLCVSCHDGQKGSNHAFDLQRGDWKEDQYRWYTSYRNLQKYAWHHGTFMTAGYDLWMSPRSIPGEVGAKASKLLPLLKKGHYNVKLNREEMRSIVLWLDCNSDFFGAYENIEQQSMGELVHPTLE